jgi:predicted ester cyclase
VDAELNRRNTLAAVKAFNAGDLDRYLTSYAPDAVIHGLPEHHPPTVEGHRAYLAETRAAIPDLRVEVHTLIVEGDHSAARLTYTGTHEGPLQGIAGTGRQLRWDAMNFRRFDDDGLTVERWLLSDSISLLHQLGSL